MTDAFHADLDELNASLVAMAGSVATAMRDASAVLLGDGPVSAEEVIAGDTDINAQQYSVDDRVVEIMTTRQPVAGDLRFMLSSIRITTDLERMGDMAAHVAKLSRRLSSGSALAQTLPVFQSMAQAANRIADKTVTILETRDRLSATQLEYDDDEMDASYERLLGEVTSNWTHGADSAVDVAMLGRTYERFADHAVRVGHQVVYLVTGEVHLDRKL